MFRSKIKKIKEKLLNIVESKDEKIQPKGMKNFELKNKIIGFLTFRRLFKYTIITNSLAIAYYTLKNNDTRIDISFSRYISRKTGWITQITIPTFFRKPLFNFYCYFYNANREEILDQNFSNYKTINEFFIRKIKVKLI